MDPIRRIESRTAVLPVNDIDTDQIIPARFLTTTDRDGLGKHLFHDWRYLADGTPNQDFVLNRPEAASAGILVAGRNFGCGSSREHAAWALADHGFRAVISSEIADIFRSNSLKNGLLPIVVDAATHDWLLENPGVPLVIDLETTTVSFPDGRGLHFEIDGFSRYCLLEGIDQLGFLLKQENAVSKFEETRPWKP